MTPNSMKLSYFTALFTAFGTLSIHQLCSVKKDKNIFEYFELGKFVKTHKAVNCIIVDYDLHKPSTSKQRVSDDWVVLFTSRLFPHLSTSGWFENQSVVSFCYIPLQTF